MSNITLLKWVIEYLSNHSLEISGTLSVQDMDRIFVCSMKIIWVCMDMLSHFSRYVVEDMPKIEIELLTKSKNPSYLRTCESFYEYLCKWRSKGVSGFCNPSELEYPPGTEQKAEIPKRYYCEALRYRFDLDY